MYEHLDQANERHAADSKEWDCRLQAAESRHSRPDTLRAELVAACWSTTACASPRRHHVTSSTSPTRPAIGCCASPARAANARPRPWLQSLSTHWSFISQSALPAPSSWGGTARHGCPGQVPGGSSGAWPGAPASPPLISSARIACATASPRASWALAYRCKTFRTPWATPIPVPPGPTTAPATASTTTPPTPWLHGCGGTPVDCD